VQTHGWTDGRDEGNNFLNFMRVQNTLRYFKYVLKLRLTL